MLGTDDRMLELRKNPHLLVGVTSGAVVQVPLTPHLEVSTRAGRKFVRLGKDDEVCSAEYPEDGARFVLMATSRGKVNRCRLKDVVAIAGVGKGKRGIKLGKKEALVAVSTLAKVDLETTRGGVHRIQAKKIGIGDFGDPGVEILTRFGFKRQKPPPLVLYELPEVE
jgi:DNA gyrase subunit A